MQKRYNIVKRVLLMTFLTFAIGLCGCYGNNSNYIINVSYDPTRELYENYNRLFEKHWEDKTGRKIEIIQSHGGSGKQALEVSNGLEADVVTLALEQDIRAIAEAGIIDNGFVDEFPEKSAPYTSIIVFLVRKDNPKKIYDWNDLLREDVGVITPNPKTSGGARWNYLAAWYYFESCGQKEVQIMESMERLYKNVLVLDSGARASTTSFVENGQGDVLLAWENEAFLCLREYPESFEIVVPSTSILCQPTVSIVDEMVKKHGTLDVATEYLNYLYSEEAQQLVTENYYRPVNKDIAKKYEVSGNERIIKEIPGDGRWIINDVELVDIEYFGGWEETTRLHFGKDGFFDRIYE